MTTNDPLYRDPELAQFYDPASRPGRADFAFCLDLAAGAGTILDLGCGTGELATAMAARYPGAAITGVDPAGAMLDIARARPNGEAVTWVEADARALRLDTRFDLIVLTGHAYQVFLTDADQAAALAAIAAHLTPGGRFIFDTRNPAFKSWENRTRANTTRHLTHPTLGDVEAWSRPEYDETTGILTYTNFFRPAETDREYAGSAQIRFTPQDRLATLIAAAGLTVETWFGDWNGDPYAPDAKELIPLGRLT